MPSLVFPSLIRSQVLEQHVELRSLLERTLADLASSLADPSCFDVEQWGTIARDLCARFRTHLAFEQEALGPVLAVLDTWGPERVRALHDDHGRQRREFDSFLETFQSGANVDQLAIALRELATDLLRDMNEEEEGCLRASLLSADSLPFERR